MQMARSVRECISMVEEATGKPIDIASLSYNRLMNHIRYMVARALSGEKLKVNMDDEKIKASVKKDMQAAIDKTLDVWLAGVELALGEFESVDQLPPRILLCGGGASLTQLVEALEKRDWYKELPFTKRPSVQRISPTDVVGVVDTTQKASDHTFITAMGLLRVGYDTMIGVSDTQTVRDKLNRILRV